MCEAPCFLPARPLGRQEKTRIYETLRPAEGGARSAAKGGTPMRTPTLAALALVLSCALQGVTHAARPGDLDPSFGDGGTVRVPVPLGDTEDVLVLPDGSIVLGGTGDRLRQDGVPEFLVARLDVNGALVREFGDEGLVSTE